MRYLPRYSFSANSNDPAMATNTSMRGLKIATNNGPLMAKHHEISIPIKPEPTTPYIHNQLSLEKGIAKSANTDKQKLSELKEYLRSEINKWLAEH